MPTEPEYDSALYDLEEALKRALRGFALWCAENWKMTDEDIRHMEHPFNADYAKGWNAACEAVDAALDSFLDEHQR